MVGLKQHWSQQAVVALHNLVVVYSDMCDVIKVYVMISVNHLVLCIEQVQSLTLSHIPLHSSQLFHFL